MRDYLFTLFDYFPQDIRGANISEIPFQEDFQVIEWDIDFKNRQHRTWKHTLEFYLEEVKAGRLSLLSFNQGIENLIEKSNEKLEEKGDFFQRFYDRAKKEIQAKLKDKADPDNKIWIENQFRFSTYQGLQLVLNQKITKEEWLEELGSYGDLIDAESYQTILELSQKICEHVQEGDLINYLKPEELIRFVNVVEGFYHSCNNENLLEIRHETTSTDGELDNIVLAKYQADGSLVWNKRISELASIQSLDAGSSNNNATSINIGIAAALFAIGGAICFFKRGKTTQPQVQMPHHPVAPVFVAPPPVVPLITHSRLMNGL